MKKSQTATEYLIILAVVIIIALIVVGVMGGIPGIGYSADVRTSAVYWRTADLAINSYSIDTDQLTITVRNNIASTIDMYAITYTSKTGTLKTEPTYQFTPGQTRQIKADLTGLDLCETDKFYLSISFDYTSNNENHTFNGEGRSLVGMCTK